MVEIVLTAEVLVVVQTVGVEGQAALAVAEIAA